MAIKIRPVEIKRGTAFDKLTLKKFEKVTKQVEHNERSIYVDGCPKEMVVGDSFSFNHPIAGSYLKDDLFIHFDIIHPARGAKYYLVFGVELTLLRHGKEIATLSRYQRIFMTDKANIKLPHSIEILKYNKSKLYSKEEEALGNMLNKTKKFNNPQIKGGDELLIDFIYSDNNFSNKQTSVKIRNVMLCYGKDIKELFPLKD
jgi:hypothetical protein